ncbi:tetratricopeptide repeat protein [Bradyrhizobium sp. 190]|uniref:tetratricopeptide repeat protein n=1 Tax=Bradyrhizobium sp. 190 TaxID=2782658 RepID=UPI0027DEC35E|nr:tetratricopeptide repeat protein [Bradyrhizobium sp. 190]MCK1517611.1 tetratricopeptide repeat protein [Bradyrhizobium sp. 190]
MHRSRRAGAGTSRKPREKFDPAHRDVGAALNNLAQAYRNQGRDGEAEPLFKRALSVREKSLGGGHPDLGQSLNNLATHCEKLGRHSDSEPLSGC